MGSSHAACRSIFVGLRGRHVLERDRVSGVGLKKPDEEGGNLIKKTRHLQITQEGLPFVQGRKTSDRAS